MLLNKINTLFIDTYNNKQTCLQYPEIGSLDLKLMIVILNITLFNLNRNGGRKDKGGSCHTERIVLAFVLVVLLYNATVV